MNIIPFQRSVPTAFYEHLALLLRQPMPLQEAIHTLRQTSPKDKPIAEIEKQLQNGLNLSQALAHGYPRVDAYEQHLLRMGERTRQLPQCLHQLTTLRKQHQHNRSQLLQACFYPCLTLTMAIIMAACLLTWVLPTCLSLYQQQNLPLPPLTQAMLHAHTALYQLAPNLLLSLIGLGAGIALLRQYPVKTEGVLRRCLSIFSPISGIGTWLSHRRYAHLCHMLYLNLSQHTTLHQALMQAAEGIPHHSTRTQLRQLAHYLDQGHPLPAALQLSPKIPELMRSKLKLSGNQSQLAQSMQQLSQSFTALAEKQSQQCLRWLNPLLLCGVSALIGTMICAIYLPLFQLGQVF